MDHIFDFHQGPEETLGHQLEKAGYQAQDVCKAVISHMHFDHVGGIREISNAELFVSQVEWQHMLGAHPERGGILRRDIDIPAAKWNKVVFQPTQNPSFAPFMECFDLMGDGCEPGVWPGVGNRIKVHGYVTAQGRHYEGRDASFAKSLTNCS